MSLIIHRSFVGVVVFTAVLLTENSADAAFCGASGNSPEQILANARKSSNFKRAATTQLYIAYVNRNGLVTLTFTTAANKAHPAVACRRAVEKGGAWHVVTEIRCRASKGACNAMAREFRALDEHMKRHLENANP